MSKRTVRLTESDLRNIISESVNKVLKEASYDANGNFDEEQHNLDLISDLNDEMRNVNNNINDALSSLNAISTMATNDRIKERARIVMNALLNAGREMEHVSRLISSNRWDID